MKTFMLGWEFPPFISGGLGTACYGLTKAMDKLGIEVTFVLPKTDATESSGHLKIISVQSDKVLGFKNVKFRKVSTWLQPYIISGLSGHGGSQQQKMERSTVKGGHLGKTGTLAHYNWQTLLKEVHDYAEKVGKIAEAEDFDIIHAHDWMTYPAGIAAAKASGKPLVVQVHSTEFDRSGENVNQVIYDIERKGMHAAAKVIAVSNYTKNIITARYGVPAEKVEVVYNGVEAKNINTSLIKKNDKIVLFMGRITMQKGPEYFVAAAKKVLEVIKNVKFIMAGTGDMAHRMINMAASLGIGHKMLFSGFLRGEDVDRAYSMADLYVMPSVSEPFGIAPLEAMQHNVPVLISKQSGVSEILTHALKVDFWDINEMTNKIVAVLKHPALHKTLSQNGSSETRKIRWEKSAERIRQIYYSLLCA